MKSLISFTKKEFTEHLRLGRLYILGALAVLVGIMNPAIAKFMPKLLELAESSSMTITLGEVTAMDSWMQFYKNIPIVLIAFILIESGIFTKEFQSGTLVLALTKGLNRYKVVVSKFFVMTVLWTVTYFATFGITYAYTAYYWDTSGVDNLVASVVFYWLFGMVAVALTVLFSTLSKSNIGVLIGTGGLIFGSYLAGGLVSKIQEYLPTKLMDGTSLISGLSELGDYNTAVLVACAVIIFSFVLSIPLFNKKSL